MEIRTAAQQRIEADYGQPVDAVLVDLLNTYQIGEVAAQLRISRETLNRWMQKHSIAVVRLQGRRTVVRLTGEDAA